MARFRPLSEHENARFGEGSFDVRDWKVRTRTDDEEVGTVHDVILDENANTRYLDVDVKGGQHVLVPSGNAQVDPNSRVVHIPGMSRKGLDALPEYDHRPDSITPEYARSHTEAFDSAYSDEHHYDRADYRSSAWNERSGGTASGKLARLDELDDVDVASGSPDPRGWDVIGADGRKVGKVDHLIGDTGVMKARYLTVELDKEVASDRRQVLLPVGHVDLDRSGKRVVSGALDRETAATLPRYEGDTIDRGFETDLTRRYNEAYTGERHFEHPRYRSEALNSDEARVQRSEEELAVGTREREAGEVKVKKHVETERVREPVEVHHEEVEVERRPVSARSGGTEMGEEEIRIPVREEEVVTQKRPRVKEEIVVKKRDVTEHEVVEEDVRKERVDVERTDDKTSRR